MAKKVFIGVGHGGKDPGAVANGLHEKAVNLAIALSCKEVLVRHGVQVKLSRETDEEDTLIQEINECNAYAPDYAVDIHNNAGGGDGVEAFYHYKGGDGKTLAQNVVDAVVAIGQNSRGIKTKLGADGRDYYGFIRQTKAPAIIVECAFLDNATDVQTVNTTAGQQAMGTAIAKGILQTLGIVYVEKEPERTKEEALTDTESKKIYRVQVGAYAVKANAEAMLKKLQAAGFSGIIV